MMTIKHITPYGNEAIYETDEVSYCPHAENEPRPTGFGPSTGALWYKSEYTGQLVSLKDGHAFVMNSAGSTVGKYDLGGWAQPG